VTVVDPDRRTPAFDDQFVRASRFAFRYFQNLVSSRYGVSWRETYLLSESPTTAPTPVNPLLADLRPPTVPLAPGDHPFGSRRASRMLTMHIEPSIYLAAVLMDYRVANGRIVVQEFADAERIRELPHPLIVNCTGMGAAPLFNDAEMLPIKGQLVVLALQPEIDYITVGPGEWSLEPNPVETTRITNGHQRLFEPMG
jgi:D-amino-acid oxidase